MKKQEKEKARASKADRRKRTNKGDEAETIEREAEGGSDSDPEEAEIWAVSNMFHDITVLVQFITLLRQ